MSPVTSQILADITGRTIEVVESPQNVGAVGAAAVAAVGLGAIGDLDRVKDFIPVSGRFEPDPEKKKIYDKYFDIFKRLYQSNKKNYRRLSL